MTEKLKELAAAFSGGRKPIISEPTERQKKTRVLVATEAAFFSERQSDGTLAEPTLHNNRFSKKLAEAALDKFDKLVVFYYDETVKAWLVDGFSLTEEQKPKVLYIHIQKDAVGDTMTRVLNVFRGVLGVRLYLPRNMRQVNWLNLNRFIRDDRVLFARADNHTELGLEMPKEKTFQDLANERMTHGWG